MTDVNWALVLKMIMNIFMIARLELELVHNNDIQEK